MKNIVVALIALPLLTAVLGAADLSGVWTLYFNPDFGGEQGQSADCTFKQNGTNLTIQCGSGAPITGEVNGQKVTFRVPTGLHDELTATFVADLDRQATTLNGTWRLVDQEKKERNGQFDAKKR